MKQKSFEDMSTQELEKSKKILSVILGFLLGASLTLLVLGIYITINKGFSPVLILPIAMLPIWILNFNNLNKIKEELKKRVS